MIFTSTTRLWTDEAQERVLPEGHPEARFLLVAEGGTLPEEDAQKYDLFGSRYDANAQASKRRTAEPDEEDGDATTTKAQEPAANKARAKAEDK